MIACRISPDYHFKGPFYMIWLECKKCVILLMRVECTKGKPFVRVGHKTIPIFPKYSKEIGTPAGSVGAGSRYICQHQGGTASCCIREIKNVSPVPYNGIGFFVRNHLRSHENNLRPKDISCSQNA